jgi:hypothetical protein
LLCVEHHAEKTSKDISQQRSEQIKPINHGKMYAWQKRKCRCDICSEARQAFYDARNERRRNGNVVSR